MFALLQVLTVIASFSKTDFRKPFVLRYGITLCADNLLFEPTDSNLSLAPSQVYVNEQACTAGILDVRLANYIEEESGQLGASLTGERDVGDVYVIDVVDQLKCPQVSFNQVAWFTFVEPNSNVEFSWARAFGRNDTTLQVATKNATFTFQSNISYVVIGSKCLYSELSEGEYDAQRGEECFPADTAVSMSNGRKERIQKLSIGDRLVSPSDPLHTCTVTGWTHWRPHIISYFVRITVTDGHALTVSLGHFVYTSNGVRPARTIGVGDHMQIVLNGVAHPLPVVSIEKVQRKGLFNVQTSCGDMIADDFVCSTYTEAVSPITAHALLTPFRIVSNYGYDVLSWTQLFDDMRPN